jgi:hypothetical protein
LAGPIVDQDHLSPPFSAPGFFLVSHAGRQRVGDPGGEFIVQDPDCFMINLINSAIAILAKILMSMGVSGKPSLFGDASLSDVWWHRILKSGYLILPSGDCSQN